MKPLLFLSAGLVCVWLTACSTPASRISRNRAAFESWPPAVQTKVQAGEIDLGFTSEQVQMALGRPDRTFTRTTQDGVAEVWAYRDRGPQFGFGLGLGTGGGSTRYGGGVAMTTGGEREEDALRVVFEGGRVSAVERVQR